MLQSVNDQRLDTIKSRLKAHGVRFSVSDIAKKTGFDKGNIRATIYQLGQGLKIGST